MGAQKKRWIVRDGKGHIFGPFDQEKIQDLLKKGVLTGTEEAAHYPAGDWAIMSADKELYELVLAALSAPVEVKARIRQKPAGTASTSSKDDLSRGLTESNPSGLEETPTLVQKAKKASQISPPPPKAPRPIIELSEKTKVMRRTFVSRNFLPLILVAAAALLFYVGIRYNASSPTRSRAINLIMPHIPQGNKGDPAKAEALLKRGWTYFYKDTFSNYVKAEESFVEAVEAEPLNPECILMLLQTDMELWPFAKQDSADQNTVQNLVQLISQVDRQGHKRAIAAATMALILGRDTTARTQVDSTLTAEPAEGRLYQMKGQLYFDKNDFQTAVAYFEKAETLLPYWVRPVYMLAVSQGRLGNGSKAQQSLLQALKMNPNHSAARLELGVIEFKFYNHEDKAKEYLTVALGGEERLEPSTEARGRYWLANILYRSGSMAAAKKEIQRAFDLDPSNPDIRDLLSNLGGNLTSEGGGSDREHMAVGDQYMRLGNYLGAQAQYKTAFVLNPHNARAAMKAAQALWLFHQSTEAMEFLQKSIVADPHFIESYVLLSDYKSQRFDFDGAIKSLDMALHMNSKSYEVFRGYANVLLRRGDLDGAEAYVNRALALYEIDVKTNILMSRVQLGKKNLVKAIQYGKRAVELDKGDTDAQVNYAKVLAAYEGVPNGVAYLNDLINTYPTELNYRVGLAEILVQDEQYGQAKGVLKQVVEVDDKNKEAFALLGDADALSGNLDDATSDYISAARIDPSDPAALFRLGEVFLKADRADKAIEQFQLVLRVNPNFPRAHYNLARAYFQSQITEKALTELDLEKKINPKLSDPYEFAGDIYLTTRKYSQAAREYQKASEIKDLGAGIYVKMSRAYRGQGAYDEALAMLRIAATRESGMADIYKEYGFIYDAKGMESEAVGSFKQYLRLEPNSPDKQLILDKINQLE